MSLKLIPMLQCFFAHPISPCPPVFLTHSPYFLKLFDGTIHEQLTPSGQLACEGKRNIFINISYHLFILILWSIYCFCEYSKHFKDIINYIFLFLLIIPVTNLQYKYSESPEGVNSVLPQSIFEWVTTETIFIVGLKRPLSSANVV